MKSMVFVLHRFQVGGVESVFLNLVNSLPNQQFYLITVRDDINTALEVSLPENVKYLDKGEVKLSVLGLYQQAQRVRGKIKGLLGMPDKYINFSDNLSSLLLITLISPTNRRVSWCHCNPEGLKNSRSYWLYKNLLKKCHSVVAVCETQKNSLIELVPELSATIRVIPNLLNLTLIDKKLYQPTAIELKDYILMVARFDSKSKDFETLIQAYSTLSNDLRAKHPLVLVGDGEDLAYIKNYVTALNLENDVVFTGNSHNPYQWMKNCKVFVLSSKTEGFSMVIFEALYCQAPVIASDCQVGPSDLLQGGQYGKLFKVGDAHGLSGILQELLLNKAVCHHYQVLANPRALQIQQQAITALKQFFG